MTNNEKFISLPHAVFDSMGPQEFEHIDFRVLLLLIRKYTGYNNGDIQLGVREVANKCQCSQATACRSLDRLQENGLISATYKGHLVPDIGRPNVPTRWRLNFKESPDQDVRKRFPNETAGCFRGETSPPTPVRFRSETSPPVSPGKRSIDNLTKAKPNGSGGTKGQRATSSAAPGDDRQHPTPEQSNPGKPNGKDHGTLRHAGGDTIH